MKKIWSLYIVVVLMISISSLVLAGEEETPEGECVWAFDKSNVQNECSQYCNLWFFENASLSYSTFEECEKCRLELINNQAEEPNQQGNDAEKPKIDIVFVIDSTGSMSDEIREVKMHIKNIIEEIRNGTPKPDVQVGFVAYRDYADEEGEYVYKIYLLTDDMELALSNLEEIDANGGGDYEEVVTIGLDVAINDMNWRKLDGDLSKYDEKQNPIFSNSTVRRMIFLIGDAPPRTKTYMDPSEDSIIPMDYKENIKDAKEKRIVICTISGSGMDEEGVLIWKEIAEETFGEYEPLTYNRQQLDEYITKEKLDDGWEVKAKESSDYDVSTGTISTNNLHKFVRSNIQLQSESMGSGYAKNVIHNVGELGFFFDTADDEEFDSFYCKKTESKASFMQQNLDTYVIDVDDDATWDYSYNSTTETLTILGDVSDLPQEEIKEQIHNPFLLLLIFAEVIILIATGVNP